VERLELEDVEHGDLRVQGRRTSTTASHVGAGPAQVVHRPPTSQLVSAVNPGNSAPEPSVAPAPSPPADAEAVAALAPTPAPVLEVEAAIERVRPLDRRVSAVRAVNALLAAWHVAPLDVDEPRTVADLADVGRRRGLEYLPLEGNIPMLRLLDLPAILELHFPDTDVRYVTLTALGDGRALITLDGAPVAVDSALLERHWFGQAHLFWRDFENLGSTMKPDVTGTHVARVQQLLGRMGLYAGPTSGVYDAATVNAVTAFQRSRLLVADGRVGRLTRIVLYAAAGGYPRPTLVESAGGTS